ncbi:MAG: hypothetical protein ABL974_06150 [Prosthecobacter sp.]
MRLTHFAFALTFILLCITGFLAWEGQEAKRGAMAEVAFLKKKQAAQEMASPNVSSMMPLPSAPATSITPPAPGTIALASPTNMTGAATLPGGGLTVPTTILEAEAKGINTNTLTPLQKQVQNAKPVAKVKTVVKEQGFVIIDAGSKQSITKGLAFDIRRGDAVLAKIRVTDTIEENEAVADLDLASIPAGVSIEPGDEIIQPVGR